MEREPQSQTVTLTELLLRTGILALKILIPMIWLRSKLSPIQFLIGGTAFVLTALLFDSRRPKTLVTGRQYAPASNLRDPGRVERLKVKEPD